MSRMWSSRGARGWTRSAGVTGEGAAIDIIGRVGTVTHVFLRNEVEYATLFEERAGGKAGSFVAPSAHLQLETEVVQAELKPATCDFRKLREPVLIEMGQRLLIHAQDLEPMVKGQTTEFMTLSAGSSSSRRASPTPRSS